MSAEVKSLLKQARESFKQDDYVETIMTCKKILKKDKSNYMALILLAAAMRKAEEFKAQVPAVLQKAIDIQADNPLAYQGLIAYYEKEPDCNENWGKLALAYCKLLHINSEPSKFSENLSKVLEFSLRLDDKVFLNQIIESLSDLRNIVDEDKSKVIDKMLVEILTYRSTNAEDHPELYEKVLKSVIEDTNVVNRQDYYRKYLKALYGSGKVVELVEEAVRMHQQFPQDVCPLEYVCRIYYEQSITLGKPPDIEIANFYEPLFKLNEASTIGAIAKAVHLKNSDNLINARELLNQTIQGSMIQSYYVWMTLSDVCIKLNCFDDAEHATRKALELAKSKASNEILRRLEITLIECLSRCSNKRKWEAASEMSEKLLKEDPSSSYLRLIHARTSVLLNDPNVCEELNILESEEKTRIPGNILRALYLKNQNRYEEAVNTLDSALEIPEAWLLLGEIYWEMCEYNHSLMAFLNGVKADRYNWQCLVYLGRYYRERGNDIERSRRCYQTAIQINPNSEQAGVGLSTAFRLLKNQDANMQLLRRLTLQDSGPKWAWLQLGLQHLDQGDATQAIKAFQHVIRADPNDNHSWESLADAYLVRGAYTSALRSYQRALELSPGSLYPSIQLANIKLTIGEHEEAKEEFERILTNEPHYVPALKGLAETCLGLGKENVARQFLGRARDNFQQAIDNLINAIIERDDLSCVWKLLGDVSYHTAKLSDKYSFLYVIPAFVRSKSSGRHVMIERKEICSLSVRCYCRALSLSQDSALLWHDLACCYLLQLHLGFTSEEKELADKCLVAAKHAVKLCPSSWLHWNFLGVVCMSPYVKNYALAQHSYVMAIDRESNNAVIWSNLGTLYLYIGNVYKANEAYSQAQRSDPAYINSWIGQALIAEKMSRKEAMDLFRHSTQLGYHGQGSLGYAHWVLSVLLDPDARKDYLYTYIIENMHAVAVATDILNWYIEHNPDDAYARNSYGLLLERQKLYRSASEQFGAALRMSNDEQKDCVCVNLARVLIQLERYDEAVDLCRAVKKATFISQCQLALSLFKAEQYEESYAEYETALQWLAETGSQKASTLCAMAAMAYIFQGVDDVKTLLFQCIQIQPPTIVGFLAAASLGILHGDLNLTMLVLEELKPYKDHEEYGHHVASLAAYSQLIHDDVRDAIVTLSNAIHRHPHDARYWVRLLRILLSTDLKTFGKCAKKALFLSRSTTSTNLVQVACASSLGYFTQGLIEQSIKSAQKIFFAYPGYVESWVTFVATLLPRCEDEEFELGARWLLKLISLTKDSFRTTREMSDWLRNTERKLATTVIS